MGRFDPAYDEVLVKGADDTARSLRVTTSEPLVLVAAGSSSATAGYRCLPVPSSGDLVVRGDVVRIEGSLEAPGRAISINARVLEVAPDAAVNVDGAPGARPEPTAVKVPKAKSGKNGRFEYKPMIADIKKAPGAGTSGDPGRDGDPGKPGGAAGWIDIRCRRLTSTSTSATFTLSAIGGSGGDGQPGQPGQDGGDGGDGYDGFIGGFMDLDTVPPVPGAKAGRGGPGGRGGAPGPAGPGGSAVLHCQEVENVQVEPPLAHAGHPGQRGLDGASGEDGLPGMNGGARKKERATGFQKAKAREGEPPDALLARRAISAQESKVVADAEDAVLAGTANADQAQLAFDRIRHDGLGLHRHDSDAVNSLADRVGWLAELTRAWPKPSEEITAINHSLLAISENLDKRRTDWFGHPPSWVPTASLRRYDELLGGTDAGLIGLFRRTEAAWADYRQARDDGQATSAHCRSAVSAARSQITELEQRLETLRERLRELTTAIQERDKPISAARAKVEQHLAEFRENTETHVNLSFKGYLDVIEQAAFASAEPAQAAAVYGTEMSKYATDAFTTVAGEDGSSVEKSWLIKKVGVLGDDVHGLDEAFSIVDGYIRNDDPGGYKLLATQRNLSEALQYYEAIDGAEQAERAMQSFVDLALDRNARILAYNDALNDLVATSSAIKDLEHRLALLETAAAEAHVPMTDPSVQAVYEAVKASCVQTLYQASRAYRFWSLRDYDVFKDVLNTRGGADVTPLVIEHGQQWIRRQALADVENFVGQLETRHDPIIVHVSAADTPDLVDQFALGRGEDDQFEPLAHYWEIKFTAPTRATTAEESPFAGMANVRLVEVRCYLEGLDHAADDAGNLKIHLTHGGSEWIAPSHSVTDKVLCDHDPIERMFEYNVRAANGRQIETAAHYWDTESDGSLSRRPDHTPVGPFTTWRVGLRPQEISEDTDWRALTGVRLEFFVRFRPFTGS